MARPDEESGSQRGVPLGQRFFDSPFLLLAAGIVVMVLFYTLWGLREILGLTQAPLP